MAIIKVNNDMRSLLLVLTSYMFIVVQFTHHKQTVALVVGDETTETIMKSTKSLPIVPLPSQVKIKKGEQLQFLEIGPDSDLNVRFADGDAPKSRAALQELMTKLNWHHNPDAGIGITLSLQPDNLDIHNEGYKLEIGNDKDIISVSAKTDVGLFYGIQTLRQLVLAPPEEAKANNNHLCCRLPKGLHIVDEPRYSHRGSMLDPARRFISLEYIKSHITRMAFFKLNKLHLHLTDDQGWRLEIKSYPRLTEIGGSTQVGGGADGGEDGQGRLWYTQQELRDLVEFASTHNIEIIPEIDMPGHTQAAIASYPEILACDNYTNHNLYEGIRVGFSYLCLSEPTRIYPFVEKVLEEVADIFPSQYIHIGGDEIQHPLYGEFITRVDQILAKLGRKTIAWQEASQAVELRNNTLLQLWTDDYDIQPALEQWGVGIILSPCSYTYLDHGNYRGQPNTYTWCASYGVPLQRVYSLNPNDFPSSQRVVGVEVPIWGEEIRNTAEDIDNRAWPRTAAAAEVSWSSFSFSNQEQPKNYTNFLERLGKLRNHLDEMGIAYYEEPDLGWNDSSNTQTINATKSSTDSAAATVIALGGGTLVAAAALLAVSFFLTRAAVV